VAKAVPPVAIIMGSQSDWPTMKHAAEHLEKLLVPYEAKIISAHRTPERLFNFARTARARGYRIIIAGAGGAAHLPGMAGGVPVGTLAIGKAGAINAGLLAAQILALNDPGLAMRLEEFREKQTASIAETPEDE